MNVDDVVFPWWFCYDWINYFFEKRKESKSVPFVSGDLKLETHFICMEQSYYEDSIKKVVFHSYVIGIEVSGYA